MDSYNLELISWPDIRTRVDRVNPLLTALLDEIGATEKQPVVLARYPYGADILNAKVLRLPVGGGETASLHDLRVPEDVREALDYSAVPVGVLLNASIEVYYETRQRVISDKLWSAGIVFGLWELFDASICADSAQLSNLSAGARSIFMLPKISDRACHANFTKQLGVTQPPPEKLSQHRSIFAEIARHASAAERWHCDVLYLPKSWINKLRTKLGKQLLSFFAEVAWEQSYNCRRQFENNIFWEDFLQTISESNIYLQPKVCSHLKQILLISEGIFPGMTFASSSTEEVAPIELIQRAYTDIYGLKLAPIIMHPAHITKSNLVYYSLNYPNYFEPYFPVKAQPRISDDLHALQIGLDLLLEKAVQNKFTYQAFHSVPNEDKNFASPVEILKSEAQLSTFMSNQASKEFPTNSPFFKGCVSIKV